MRGLASIFAAAVVVSACASQPVPEAGTTTAPGSSNSPTSTIRQLDPAGSAFAEARAKWDAAALGTYSYEFLDDCGECDQLPTQSVVVWDGDVLDPLRRATSIDQAFALIERSIERGADVDVEYHPELGYPTDLWIDREARAYDGGIHLVFDSVAPDLPGDPASLDTHRAAWDRWRATGLESYEYSSAVICECEYQVSMRTTVVDGLVTAFDSRTPEPTDITFSPLTIEQMFSDVEAFLAGEDFPSEGIRVTGSALYDEQYGYPVWIGLDIEVTDPEAAAEAGFPPRLVMTVSSLEPLISDPASEVEEARAKWRSQAIDTYTFDIVFHDIVEADYSEAFTVEVESGVIVSVTENGYEYPPEDVEVPTIDELFDAIVNWQLSGGTVDAIYHAELGYPTVVIAAEPDGTSTSVSVTLRR